MAYYTHLHSVSQPSVQAFYENQNELLHATRSIICSHIIAHAAGIQPLGELLGRALDGGDILHPDFIHPFQLPKIHSPLSISELYPRLKMAWDKARAEWPVVEEDWYGTQIQQVVDLFEWAYSRDEQVVSYLQPAPMDYRVVVSRG